MDANCPLTKCEQPPDTTSNCLSLTRRAAQQAQTRSWGWGHGSHSPCFSGVFFWLFLSLNLAPDGIVVRFSLGSLACFLSRATCWMTSTNLDHILLAWIVLSIFYFVLEKKVHIKIFFWPCFIFFFSVFSRHQRNKSLFLWFHLSDSIPLSSHQFEFFTLLTHLDIKQSQDQHV